MDVGAVDQAMAPPAQPMPRTAPPGHAAPRAAAPGASPKAVGAPAAARGAKEVQSSSEKKLKGDHMLIFTGNMAMEVERGDVAASIDEIVDEAVELGGYVVKQDNKSVTIRVPSASFRAAMREIEKIGEVTHRGVQAEDVSEEYHDLGVRLKSLRATRARLEKFLDRAKSIQEVLRVEQELSRLNGEIDRIEGRMRFLAQRSAMSTITVSLSEKPETKKVIVKKPPKRPAASPKTRPLPIDWLNGVGLDTLLNLN